MPHPTAQSLLDRIGSPVIAITAYDYPSARLCDEADIDIILVGDSLGMVVAGCEDTTTVTLEQIAYHTTMVRRGVSRAVLVSDLPIHTYNDPAQALQSSRILMDAGADAVKLEGGLRQIEKIEAIVAEGIPVCGHLGMLPQRVREEGGYKKKGKTDHEASQLKEAALRLQEAGVFAIVLESVVPRVAEEITRVTEIPMIGIGAGAGCDGQIRVLHDVVGGYPWFVPPFAKVYGNVAEVTSSALKEYASDVRNKL